jgi:hypothetical protein
VKKFLFIGLLLMAGNVFGQREKLKHDPAYDKKTLHFGFTLGLNTMDFTVVHNEAHYNHDSLFAEVDKLRPGFNINIVSNLKLNEMFDLRFLPGVSFGQRNLLFHKQRKLYNDNHSLESSFIEFPLVVKYKSKRVNNFRPYLLGGADYRIDLAARKEYDENDNVYVRLKRGDLYYEVGFGIDFYLPYFKFSPELKLATGLRDVLVHEPAGSHPYYVQSMDKIRSSLIILSFHFE